MHTEIIRLDPDRFDPKILKPAAEAIDNGGIVIFPTETVYGMAVNRDNPSVVARLLNIRKSPMEKLLTVHISSKDQVKRHWEGPIPGPARRLMDRLWPGPLTLVLGGPDERSLGFRYPNHRVACELVRQTDATVVAPSANISGQPPATAGDDAIRQFSGAVEVVIDAGPTRYKGSSTVVRVLDRKVEVLREGAISRDTVMEIGTVSILFVCTGNTCRSPIAEFMFRKMLARQYGISEDDLESRGYRVASAGTAAGVGSEAFDQTMEVAREYGLNLEKHRSQPVTITLIEEADVIYIMTPSHRDSILDWVPEAKDKIFPLDPAGGEIDDPVGGSKETYRKCITKIKACLEQRVKEY